MKSRDLIVVALSAVLFMIMIFPLRGSMIDDTYIHMQYARNLAETGELSFNRGDPTYGATSPLWVMILAFVHLLGGDMSVWCGVLSRFFGFASILLVFQLVRILDGKRAAAYAAVLMAASEAWLIRWSAVGMESSFAVFMVLASILLAVRAGSSTGSSILFALALYLSYLARPETLLMVPLAAVSFVAVGGKERIAKRLSWLAAAIPLFAVWFVIIKKHTGTYFPLTAGAKQGGSILSGLTLHHAAVPLRIIAATGAFPALALLALIVLGISTDRGLLRFENEVRRRSALLALLWIAALPAAYVVLDFQVLSRYMIPVTVVLTALGAMAAARLAGRFAGKYRTAALTIFTAAVIAQNILFYSIVVVRPTREFTRGLNEVIVGIGRYLGENALPGESVATPDIGAIGYYSGMEVLDLGGLVSPEINRMRKLHDYDEIVDEGLYLVFEPDYLVDRSPQPLRFSGKVIGGVEFLPVVFGTVENLGIRQPGPVVYVLYRLDWSRAVGEEGKARSGGAGEKGSAGTSDPTVEGEVR